MQLTSGLTAGLTAGPSAGLATEEISTGLTVWLCSLLSSLLSSLLLPAVLGVQTPWGEDWERRAARGARTGHGGPSLDHPGEAEVAAVAVSFAIP